MMRLQIPPWFTPAAWGGVIGAILIAVVGFSAGWVVTSGNAKNTAERQAERAVITALTPICVAQFKGEPQMEQTTHLAALQKEHYWKRADYVEKQGWATMPGSNDPNDEVAEACTAELLKLGQEA
jgi:hypothetical protein